MNVTASSKHKKEGPLACVLPALPYAPDALEPYIDKQTMEIHHGKHHNAYVTNLNKALEGHADLQALSIDQLLSSLDRVPENIRGAVRNNGGGHWNHSMFWKIMKKMEEAASPPVRWQTQLNPPSAHLPNSKQNLLLLASDRFGSGWAWVVVKDGKLAIESTQPGQSPFMAAEKLSWG